MTRTLTVGRDATCDIVLPADDTRVSRVHARIQILGGGHFSIEDLGSTNGVAVNGQRVRVGEFRRGDRISFGTLELDMAQVWRFDAAPAAEPDWLDIGRDPSNRIVLPADASQVSRTHARVRTLGGDTYEIVDVQSGNGVFVNGRRVDRATVRPGDAVSLGSYPIDLQRLLGAAPPIVRPVTGLGPRFLVPTVLGAAALAAAVAAVVMWPSSPAAPVASTDTPPLEAATSDGAALDPAQIFERYGAAVVLVGVAHWGGEGIGTGFFVDSAGTLVTNHHVVDGAKEVGIKLMSGEIVSDVTLVADDDVHDLAVLRVRTSVPLRPVVLASPEIPRVGERVVSIGNPVGLDHSLTDGVVSAYRDLGARSLIQMSAPISPGNSGGPVFNMRGEVIGVAVGSINGRAFGVDVQGLNLAVPVSDVLTLLASSGWAGATGP